MKLNKNIAEWIINHQSSLLLNGLITFTFPRLFIKSYYNSNKGKKFYWGKGKKRSCLTISFDCDYPQDVECIPEVLQLLSKYSIRTSFACVGHWIEKYPREHKMLLDQGHEIVNHTYSHPDNEMLNPGRKFKHISRQEKKEEVERCHDVCKKYLNYEPKGCRIPHFKNLFTNEIYGILKELNYKYSSSTWIMNTKTFGFPFITEGIYEFPLTTCPKHPFTVFDTWHSMNSKHLAYKLIHNSDEDYFQLFVFLINLAIETGSYINIYIDPYDVAKIKRFGELLGYLNERKNDVWIATYEEMITEAKDCFMQGSL